jgi:uncharacterized protein (DUF342 family)
MENAMTRDEFLDFYDENWNDHNKVYSQLLKLFEAHERQIALLKNSSASQKEDDTCDSKDEEIAHLKAMLQQCHDSLDEERHKIENFKK